MSWIRTIPDSEASEDLARLYEAARDPVSGRLDEILQVHSLHPAGLSAHLGLYRAVMGGSRGLRKVERELIALHVSRINGCHY
jgi:alkylhydroperoxidase family enzyme